MHYFFYVSLHHCKLITERSTTISSISNGIYSVHLKTVTLFSLELVKSYDRNNTNKYSSIIHQVVMLPLKVKQTSACYRSLGSNQNFTNNIIVLGGLSALRTQSDSVLN